MHNILILHSCIIIVKHVTVGSHFSLWCLIRSDQLKVPPAVWDPAQPGITNSMLVDHVRYLAAGGNMKNAKAFNNCISKPFFPELDLSQVCNSTYLGLHIS